jgi:hypothetical protein
MVLRFSTMAWMRVSPRWSSFLAMESFMSVFPDVLY